MMSFFKGYDIRGLVPQELDEPVAEKLGRAFGTMLAARKSASKMVFIARDNRSHSFRLKEAFCKGVRSTGFDVKDLGVAPTPVLQFALATGKAAGGCIVTASHNPPEYNGFKMYSERLPFLSPEMAELERVYGAGQFSHAKRKGKESREKILEAYVSDVLARVHPARKIRIVFDSGNGTCGPIARALFELMGLRVHGLFEDPESAFLNHLPDPHKPENLKWLQEEVKRVHADLGVAFDGDADRAAFVDDQGNIVRGDDAFILFARSVLARKPKGTLVYELRFSKVVPEEIARLKGKAVMSKAGRIAVREELEKRGALLGGEITGHYSFAEHFGFDDGIYAGAKMAQIVSQLKGPLSSELALIPKYVPTQELRLHCPEDKKAGVLEFVKSKLKARYGSKVKTLDGVYLDLGDAWGLVRKSNTEPALTLRFEGKTRKALERVYALYGSLLKQKGIRLPALAGVLH